MAPPLACIAKHFLPLECLSIVQQYAADKRAPHPVALLVKRFETNWVLCQNYFDEKFTLETRTPGVRLFQWEARPGDGEFTRQTMGWLESTNREQRKRAKDEADLYNVNFRLREPTICRHLKRIFETMQGTEHLPCSLSSCPDAPGCSASPVRNKAWQSRGWSKHGSKRVKTGYIRSRLPLDSDSD